MTDLTKQHFFIGIDLGTTNCALSFTTAEKPDLPQCFAVQQWETESTTVQHNLLPSFYYLPQKSEWKRGQLKHVWASEEATPDFVVGRFARSLAATQPGRVIHSAKSWICHGGVSREDRILPWHSDELIGDDRRSPVEVSSAFLQHLKEAWNHAHVGDENRLERQIVTITVPASFDETAQMLTVRAAEQAGFSRDRIHLLEEPQAAFYSWLRQVGSAEVIQSFLNDGEEKTVLICDIGGGTSDFSLFSMRKNGETPQIERIAVSEHLLLGGDNIDLAIAQILETRLTSHRLSSKQWAQLVAYARQLKERALSDKGLPEEELHVALAGEGSSLFAKTLSAKIKRSEVLDVVLKGFFPECAATDEPVIKSLGLKALGLPYAEDSAVTRYLAKFVTGRKIDSVLFAGGTLIPDFLQKHLLSVISNWQKTAPKLLTNHDMDLAVAHGAAVFSATFIERESTNDSVVTSGRIKAGYPRSLYLELGHKGNVGERSLLCIVPKGFDGTTPLRIDNLKMQALVGSPVKFQLFSSLNRDSDKPGTLLKFHQAEFHPLNPLHTVLKAAVPGRSEAMIDVALEVVLMSTGMLQLFCVNKNGSERWQLEFNVRDFSYESSGDLGELADSDVSIERFQAAVEKIGDHFGKKKKPETDQDNPKYLVRTLEEILGRDRKDWNVSTLRKLWPHLREGMTRKNRSLGHELAWLYLVGYCLRPGYGVELDEWRVNDLWKAYELGLAFPKERQNEEQWWIMWRRVAGGLSRSQQEKLFDKVFPAIRKGNAPSLEVYMLAGSLERIEMNNKVRLGNYLVQQISEGRKQFLDQKLWALARIGSRVLMHGSSESIVRPVFVEEWFGKLRGLNIRDKQYSRLSIFISQVGRIVNDREFDLSIDTRKAMVAMLENAAVDDALIKPLREFVPVDSEAKSKLFGEELPSGLILSN
jgi:molecular chaperone DnaK (HSP70)